ncbi:MAG: DUF262 domain-containing protein [Nitrospirota bacterium]|nr:DUF262 domain-containing protein [Nitrospirota bacterium]
MSRTDFKNLSLDEQIDALRSNIRTDKLDLTYGEFSSMYEAGELIVAPEYQRLFRWSESQKSRFIESILLGIPTPAIFVAETEKGIWELVDGLQRLSTVLEFFGVLKKPEGIRFSPSILEADDTAKLPALDGMIYENLTLRSRLSIRRTGCRVEVIKVGSDRKMKYDLFERLNTGGAQLTDQEVRNCIFRAEAPDLMEYFDRLAQFEPFQMSLGLSDLQQKSLYDRGLVLRFFALKNNLNDFRHDVEPFITEYVHKVVDGEVQFDKETSQSVFEKTTKLIWDALGQDSYRHIRDSRHQGAFSVYVFEALSIGVANNLEYVESLNSEVLKKKLTAIKESEDFRASSGQGGNTKARLLQRLKIGETVIGNHLPEASNVSNE